MINDVEKQDRQRTTLHARTPARKNRLFFFCALTRKTFLGPAIASGSFVTTSTFFSMSLSATYQGPRLTTPGERPGPTPFRWPMVWNQRPRCLPMGRPDWSTIVPGEVPR